MHLSTATILIYPRPQAKALVRFATESAWAGTARKTVALLYLSRDIISALGLWYKRIPKSSYKVVRELQLCSPSPVPRPTLAPSQNGLAHEVEFLGFMGGATSLLIDHSRCELLYKGLLRSLHILQSHLSLPHSRNKPQHFDLVRLARGGAKIWSRD